MKRKINLLLLFCLVGLSAFSQDTLNDLTPAHPEFSIIFWLLIALFGLAIVGKLSGKLKEKYINWGYGTNFMYALAIAELIAIVGLFTQYSEYAAWFLLAIMGGAFFTHIKHKENWKAYLLPLLTTILLSFFLLFKSGRLVGWLF